VHGRADATVTLVLSSYVYVCVYVCACISVCMLVCVCCVRVFCGKRVGVATFIQDGEDA